MKKICLLIILIILIGIFFLSLLNNKERYAKFSTGDCRFMRGQNCPPGSYNRSCNVSWNVTDWGDAYVTGTCDKEICTDRGSFGRCDQSKTIKNNIFAYMPANFSSISFKNDGGNLVMGE